MKKKYFIGLIKKSTPRWLVLLIDCYIVGNAFLLAYLVRYDFSLDFDKSQMINQLIIVVFAALVSFLTFGSYKGTIRHTQIGDAFNVTVANFTFFIVLFVFVLINREFSFTDSFEIPLSVLVIHFLVNTIVLISIRYFYKELYKLLLQGNKLSKIVIIYGAGETGLL